MARSVDSAAQRRKLLGEIARLAEIAIFGTLSETYRTCGQAGCHCQGDGPKHGPHLNVSYRGEKGKTTGYYVPKGAQQATRQGVEAWQKMQQHLRELAELNKERNLRRAREADSRWRDRKSTRLNSSHGYISYGVFCLKKKNVSSDTSINLFTDLSTSCSVIAIFQAVAAAAVLVVVWLQVVVATDLPGALGLASVALPV